MFEIDMISKAFLWLLIISYVIILISNYKYKQINKFERDQLKKVK